MIIQIASSSYCNPLGILICVSNKKMLSDVPLTERQVTCAITGIGAASLSGLLRRHFQTIEQNRVICGYVPS